LKRILFVCRANICRSPIAEGIARKLIIERNLDVTVDSAGTINFYENELPCESSVKIAALHDVDISTIRSRQVKKSDSMNFDYIVAMDNKIIKSLKSLGFNNVHHLGNYGGYNGTDVPDPYFLKDFEDDIREVYSVYTMIEACVKDFINSIRLTEKTIA